ncbi:hypothetical protein ACKKBG_A36625 [Auxenochlorella protothecoides x Auxenochlorella symbiontica]
MAGPGLNILHELRRRECFGPAVLPLPPLGEFTCGTATGSGVINNDPSMVGSPAFAASFNGVYNHGRLLALADEEGYLTIIDTSQALPRSTADEAGPRPSAQWLAHRNAIFDLAWFREDEAMLAASGDQTISLWDTGMAEQLGTFCGHTGSVKTLDPMPGSRHVFASGARDGQLAVWDTRIHTRTPEGGTPPVLTVQDAHAAGEPRRRGRPRTPLQGRPKLSVTSALFLPDARTLATGGVDGMVRLWDLRRGGGCAAAARPGRGPAPGAAAAGASLRPVACISSPPLGSGLKQHGVTCLALHPDGARLLVSLTGGHHLAFDVLRPGAGPRAVYAGHAAASFYVKAGFSPDGRFLASGSSDRRVHVWEVDGPPAAAAAGGPALHAPLAALEGHEGEVTAVAWCPTDPDRLASAADDATVRVWARRPRARDPEPAAERCPRSARQLLSGFLGEAACRGWAGEPAERPAPRGEGRTGPASDPAAPERCATTAISAGALPGLATPATPRGAGTGERGGGSPPPAWRLADYATPGGALAGRSGAAGSGATGRKRARQASIAAFFTSPLRRPVIDLTCQAPG